MSVNHRGVCQIAFRSNPGDASYVWDDVSRWLMEYQTRRGRQYELNAFQAGTANIVLDNSYRLFDPSNLAGPYAPNVLPMKPIRVGAQRNLLAALDALASGGSYSWASLVNSTITQNASDPPAVTAWQLTPSGAGNISTTSGPVTVFPGEPLLAMAQFVGTTNARSCRVDVNFTTATGGAVSTVTGATVADNTSTFTNVTTAATAPATAALATITLTVLSTSGATDKHWFNKVGLIPADDAAAPVWCAGGPQWDFTGYIETWPPEAHDPEWSIINLAAADGFLPLSQMYLPDSVYYSVIKAEAPTAWYRLGEKSGTTAVDSSGNARHGTYLGGATFHSTSSLIYGSSDAAIAFDGVDDAAQVVPVVTGFPCSIEGWISYTSGGTSQCLVYQQISFDGQTRIYLETGTDGSVAAAAQFAPPTSFVSATTAALTFGDGQPHHVVATFANATTAPLIYVDGVAKTTTTSAVGTPVPFTTDMAHIGKFGLVTFFAGTVDEVSLYNVVLTPAQVLTHYNAGTLPWNGDSTGTRIGRILDLIGWPSAARNLESGASTLGPVSWQNNTTTLSYAQLVEKAEQGRFFVDANGNMVFQSRYHSLLQGSKVTFSDVAADAATALAYSEAKPDTNANLIRNTIQVQRLGGSTYTVQDDASRTAYYPRVEQLTGLLTASDIELLDLAAWRIDHLKNPVQRWQFVALDLSADGNGWATLHLREIGDKVTMKRNPPGGGTAIAADQFIEGISYHWVGHGNDAGRMTAQVNLSPADLRTYLILDDPTYGQLDANSLAF